MNPHVRTGIGTAVGIALGIAGSSAVAPKWTPPPIPPELLADRPSTDEICSWHHRGHWHDLVRLPGESCDSENQKVMQRKWDDWEDAVAAGTAR